jgi:AraC family transcriptional regulator
MLRVMQAGSDRPVYEGRVNAVMDYIEAHLGDELTVEQLAEVAHFSPYHFHRIFSAMTGETLGGFIARVRLEHAASRLVAQPRRPVTDIALECGFASPSSFSRAFREAYGTTPTGWRSGGHRQHERVSRDPAADPTPEDLAARGAFGVSGTRLSVRSGRTVWDVSAGSLGTVVVHVEQVEHTEVAYVRYTGRYQGLAEVFVELYGRLMRWAEPRGFVAAGTPLFNLYHDDPSLTDDDRLRVTICVPVPPDTPAEGDIGRTAIPAGAVAVGRFELGVDDYPEAWYAMAAGWLPDSGYEPDDRLPFERFVVGRTARREGAEVAEIGMPVRPLRRD